MPSEHRGSESPRGRSTAGRPGPSKRSFRGRLDPGSGAVAVDCRRPCRRIESRSVPPGRFPHLTTDTQGGISMVRLPTSEDSWAEVRQRLLLGLAFVTAAGHARYAGQTRSEFVPRCCEPPLPRRGRSESSSSRRFRPSTTGLFGDLAAQELESGGHTCGRMTQREVRQKLLRERLQDLSYRDAIAGAAQQLSELLDVTVSPDQALPRSAVDAARETYSKEGRFHLVWRRVWGVHLRDEMLETARRLGSCGPETAHLVWVTWDREHRAAKSTPVAFQVTTTTALTQLPPHLGPRPGEVGPGGVGSDLLLVSAEGSSGVHLDYQHHADRDEYEMFVWGAFARPVVF